jgi:hypothetical protein
MTYAWSVAKNEIKVSTPIIIVLEICSDVRQ